MSASPYEKTRTSIPVTIVTSAEALRHANPDAARLVIEPSRHQHAPGTECVACAATGDVRAMLFDLLTAMRQGLRPAFTAVVVDASRLVSAQPVIDRLDPGAQPAMGLRDHTVARSFHLSRVI